MWNFAWGPNGPPKIGELLMYFNRETLWILLGALRNSNGGGPGPSTQKCLPRALVLSLKWESPYLGKSLYLEAGPWLYKCVITAVLCPACLRWCDLWCLDQSVLSLLQRLLLSGQLARVIFGWKCLFVDHLCLFNMWELIVLWIFYMF